MTVTAIRRRLMPSSARSGRAATRVPGVDPWLSGLTLMLLALGLLMVTTASMPFAEKVYGNPLYFVWKQAVYVMVGMWLAWLMTRVRMEYLEQLSPVLLGIGFLLLFLLFVPGLGVEVNGSRRWLNLLVIRLQPSELMKLFMVLYIAGYIARHQQVVRGSLRGFLLPMVVTGLACLFFLVQPDFGASVVLAATVMVMLFLAGTRLSNFLLPAGAIVLGFALLATGKSYRLERLTSFLEPWEHQFDSGFQLTQALIAFGRGEWFGVGLGNSVQKLHYLPESHTDFVLAILAEELGLIGMLAVLIVYGLLLWRMFRVADVASRRKAVFSAMTVYGVTVWMAGQMLINVGVNMGVLPTKGLTLPLMSYGGSSIVVMCCAVAMVMRVDIENRLAGSRAGNGGKGR